MELQSPLCEFGNFRRVLKILNNVVFLINHLKQHPNLYFISKLLPLSHHHVTFFWHANIHWNLLSSTSSLSSVSHQCSSETASSATVTVERHDAFSVISCALMEQKLMLFYLRSSLRLVVVHGVQLFFCNAANRGPLFSVQPPYSSVFALTLLCVST